MRGKGNMKKNSFFTSVISILLALMIIVHPGTSLTSYAAQVKLTSLNYTGSHNSFDSYHYPTTGITTPDGKEYSGNIVFFDASLINTYVEYNLNSKYVKLTGDLVTSTSTGAGVFDLTFYGDGKKLATYKGISRNQNRSVSVDVSGVKTLKITAENTGSYAYGWVYLVNGMLGTTDFSLSDKSLVLDKGDSTFIDYTYGASDNVKASWSSSNKNVAKVSTKGQVKAVGTGTCTITCKIKNEKRTVKVVVRPQKMSGVKVKSKGANFVQLEWVTQKNATGYQIYSYDKDFKEYSLEKTVKKGASSSVRITGLRKKTSYKFKVRAYLKANGKNNYGEFSKVITVKTK